MISLPKAVSAWGSPAFNDVLKREIEQLDGSQLPLQQGLSASSHALDDSFSVMIISVTDAAGFIGVKLGIFYSGIIAGCSCADDPTPVEAQSEYCVVRLDIDKSSAEARVTLLAE